MHTTINLYAQGVKSPVRAHREEQRSRWEMVAFKQRLNHEQHFHCKGINCRRLRKSSWGMLRRTDQSFLYPFVLLLMDEMVPTQMRAVVGIL